MLLRILTFVGDFHNGGPLLVDVRRTDYEGGAIAGSINMPAQSFWMNRAVLYKLCRGLDLERIIFYCGKYGTPSNKASNSRSYTAAFFSVIKALC